MPLDVERLRRDVAALGIARSAEGGTSGAMGVVRAHLAETGYAEGRVPVISMHWAPKGLSTSYADQPSAGW